MLHDYACMRIWIRKHLHVFIHNQIPNARVAQSKQCRTDPGDVEVKLHCDRGSLVPDPPTPASSSGSQDVGDVEMKVAENLSPVDTQPCDVPSSPSTGGPKHAEDCKEEEKATN